jgi:hypothetical protein
VIYKDNGPLKQLNIIPGNDETPKRVETRLRTNPLINTAEIIIAR